MKTWHDNNSNIFIIIVTLNCAPMNRLLFSHLLIKQSSSSQLMEMGAPLLLLLLLPLVVWEQPFLLVVPWGQACWEQA